MPYSTHMRNNYEIRGVAYRKKTKRMVSGSDISSDGKRDTPAGDLYRGDGLSDVSGDIEKSGGKL